MTLEREQSNSPEDKEIPTHRQVEVLMVRHGQQEDIHDPDSPLSNEGEKQADEFVEEILDRYRDEEVVIKVKDSTAKRASQTGERITSTLEKRIDDEKLEKLNLLKERKSKELKTTGTIGKVMNAGIEHEDAVDEWLAHADQYPDAKKPEEISKQIEKFIASTDALAKRLPNEGPKIVYIWVTHESAHASILHKLTGKNTKELGGAIGNLEPLVITTDNGSETRPKISFRGHDYELKNDEES